MFRTNLSMMNRLKYVFSNLVSILRSQSQQCHAHCPPHKDNHHNFFHSYLFTTGDVRQQTWHRIRETGDVIQETWGRRQETGDVRQELWDRNRETGIVRRETGDVRQETWHWIRETGDVREDTEEMGDVRQGTWDRRLDKKTGNLIQETREEQKLLSPRCQCHCRVRTVILLWRLETFKETFCP